MKRILLLTVMLVMVFVIPRQLLGQTVLSADFNSVIPAGWVIDATQGATWFRNDSMGTNNTGCAMIAMEDLFGGQIGRLITGSMDLSSVNQPALYFSIATVNNSSPQSTAPLLELSYDTGNGWKRLNSWAPHGDSAIVCGTDLWPPLDQQNVIWHSVYFDLSQLANETNIKFAFDGYIIHGGFLLLDDVQIKSPNTLSVAQRQEEYRRVKVYPNPAQHTIHIDHKGRLEPVTLEVYDAVGKRISNIKYTVSHTSVVLSTTTLSNGTYFLHLKLGDNTTVEKVIVAK